ncbi:MAG: hypothetical protein Q9163_005648 [Psora crenata]
MGTIQFSEGGHLPSALRGQKQLVNNIVDGMAKNRPQALYAEIPVSPNSYEDGYRKVTYSELANAINGVAWWLKEKLGQGKEHETLAYIGPNDIGYVPMVLGAVKAGYKLLLVSPRNPISDHISLFEATGCKVLLTPAPPHSPLVRGILKACPLRILDSPCLPELLEKPCPHYPFPKTFAAARQEPLVVVHTSGTTAVPKPIVYSHDFAASVLQYYEIEAPAGFESQAASYRSTRFFLAFPFFHGGSLFVAMMDAIAHQTIIVTPLAGATPSAQVVVDGLKHTKADVLTLPPPFFEQIARSPEMLEFVSRNVDTVVYGGGDVSQWSGDALAAKIQVLNIVGATEIGAYPLLQHSNPFEDWKYIHPHPALGLEFRPSVHGLYEGFIKRNANFEDEQPVFKIFPHLEEYPTKDLWSPHPSKPDLWAYRGRADDIIVFKPGYMCETSTMEQHVLQHPGVRAVLMAGTGRSQPALLIERFSDQPLSPTGEQEFIEELWPTIDEVNQRYKLGARISKSHIIFTDLHQPMRRASKGTVQRRPTLSLYKEALDALYAREGDGVPGNELVLPMP